MKPTLRVLGWLLGSSWCCLAVAAPATLKLPPDIVSLCATPPNTALICEDLQEFLDAFNAESRHDAWAKDMEARIRKAMRVGGKELREIRTLQCRRARCVLVYRVAEKDAEREVDGDGTLARLMDLRAGAVGPESGAGSEMIGMLVWQEREHIEDTGRPESYRPARK